MCGRNPCREGPRLPHASGPARLLAAGPDGGLPRGSRVCSALPGRKWTDGPGAGSSEGLSQNEVKVGNPCSSENLGIDNHGHALRVFYKESIGTRRKGLRKYLNQLEHFRELRPRGAK